MKERSAALTNGYKEEVNDNDTSYYGSCYLVRQDHCHMENGDRENTPYNE